MDDEPTQATQPTIPTLADAEESPEPVVEEVLVEEVSIDGMCGVY